MADNMVTAAWLPERLTRYTIGELGDKVLWHGRMPKREMPVLWNTGSGIEFSVKAREVWIELDTSLDGIADYVRVTVNGYDAVRQPVMHGGMHICAYRSLNAEAVHTVRLYKEGQPFGHVDGQYLAVSAILTDGEIVEPPARKYRFEVIGDSITSGEGLGGAACERDWTAFNFSTRGSYALLLGEALDANIDLFAFSGQGICCSGKNDPRHTLPKRYGYVVGKTAKGVGAAEEFDPAERGYDAVIINLGTNDSGAPGAAPFVDPETGETFALRRDENKRLVPESRRLIFDAAAGFIKTLREKNPKLRAIVFVCAMMYGTPEICEIYEEVASLCGEGITSVVHVPTMNRDVPGMVGSRSHPGAATHAAAAEAIAAHMRALGF